MSVTSAGEGDLAAKQLGSESASRSVYPSKSSLIEGRLMLQEVAHDNNFNLTETVYSQFTTHHSLKKAAFTLAEVLITLGIIGVVAAITLPTLIKNYQKQVYVTQLKKVVNTLENNSRKILADEGVDSLKDTPLYSVDGSIPDGNHDFKLNKDYFEKHYKLTPLSETTEYAKMIKSAKRFFTADGDDIYNYYSNDGACITVFSDEMGWYVIVDINCDKRPNNAGYDQFVLRFSNNGLITFDGGVEATFCTSEMMNMQEENHVDVGEKLAYIGAACFARIVQDGWKMNY